MQDNIQTEEEYRKAIMRFLEICDAEPGTTEYEEAKDLTSKMELYEDDSCSELKNSNLLN
jgi:antitoxin component HigA of HigAB toxin-antitoxin module